MTDTSLLDVFNVEPLPTNHAFRSLDNVLSTPHIGYVVRDLCRIFFGDTVKNITRWLGDRYESDETGDKQGTRT
jgi:phosphoglycerate dehydrogenase-like enzyme